MINDENLKTIIKELNDNNDTSINEIEVKL